MAFPKKKPEIKTKPETTKKGFGKGKKAPEKSGGNTDIIFAKGVNIYHPHENAPDFVKASIVLSLADLIEWCENNQDKLFNSEKYGEQLKLSIKESKGGALYCSVDTYGTEFSKQ